VTLPADAEKLADEAPEATVTLAWTVTAELLLERATTAFPEAALFRVTVQFDVAPLAIDDGLQFNEVTCVGTVTLTVAWADPL
jgi:hypothetical protein